MDSEKEDTCKDAVTRNLLSNEIVSLPHLFQVQLYSSFKEQTSASSPEMYNR